MSFSVSCHSVLQSFIIMACHLIAQQEFKYLADSYKGGDRAIVCNILSISLKYGCPLTHLPCAGPSALLYTVVIEAG